MSLLYHYCPTSSFFSIIQGMSIWITPLKFTNDYLEGNLISNYLQKPSFKKYGMTLDVFNSILDGIMLSYDQYAFSLSMKGDLLSQWRGYADDAHGFSIGFDEILIKNLIDDKLKIFNPQLLSVIYNKHEHINIITELLEDFKSNYNNKDRYDFLSNNKGEVFYEKIIKYMHILKPWGFHEEKEKRILMRINNRYALHPLFHKFKSNKDIISPYIELSLINTYNTPNKRDESSIAAPCLIAEVIIGPKNRTPINIVEIFLKESNFNNVLVKKSEISYR